MANEVKLGADPDLKKEFAVPTYDEWKRQVEKDLKGDSFEKKLITKTYEGIDLKPLYTSADVESLHQTNNFPGFENYLRGCNTTGYNAREWEIASEYKQALPEELNNALKYDLERGLNSINIKLDEPTMLGLDADQSVPGVVGKDGLSISGIRKMHVLFNGIDLTNQPINISGGFSALPFTLLFKAYADESRTSLMNIRGSITSDPYEYLLLKGSLPVSLDQIFDEIKYATELMIKSNSPLRTIGISGLPFINSGSSAVQELAYTMATGAEYLSEMTTRGLNVDDIVKRIRFTFGIGSFYFMEIAKLRAARMLWSNILEAYNVSEDKRRIYIHARAADFNQTLFDPYVNMLRTTTEAFSSIVGGADSIQTNPFNEIFNTSDPFARRIARNTQIILKEESHLDQVIDPAGGSFFLEKLTDELARSAWKVFQEVDKNGGMFQGIISGSVKNEVEKVANDRKKDFSKRKTVLVGTNMYANPKEKSNSFVIPDYELIYQTRIEYIQKYRVTNENKKHQEIINKLQKINDSYGYELIDLTTDAFLDGASIGEISRSIRATSTKGINISPLISFRLSEMFEALRIASEKFQVKNGSRPKIFLAAIGQLKQYKARADFSRAFFEVGGFEIIYPEGFNDTENAVRAAVSSGAQIVVICSTDENYPQIVPDFVKGIKDLTKEIVVVLAGYPKDQVEAHKKSGVDEFIYLGADVYKIISDLLKRIGVN